MTKIQLGNKGESISYCMLCTSHFSHTGKYMYDDEANIICLMRLLSTRQRCPQLDLIRTLLVLDEDIFVTGSLSSALTGLLRFQVTMKLDWGAVTGRMQQVLVQNRKEEVEFCTIRNKLTIVFVYVRHLHCLLPSWKIFYNAWCVFTIPAINCWIFWSLSFILMLACAPTRFSVSFYCQLNVCIRLGSQWK